MPIKRRPSKSKKSSSVGSQVKRSAVKAKLKGKAKSTKSKKPTAAAKKEKVAKAKKVTRPVKKVPKAKPKAPQKRSTAKTGTIEPTPAVVPVPEAKIPLGSYSFTDFGKGKLAPEQMEAAAKIDAFLQSRSQRCLIVQGFAGTGKTFLLGLLNEYLIRMKRRRVLMAPTGRAARLLRERTGSPASTIHATIYAAPTLKTAKKGIRFTFQFPLGTIDEEDHDIVAVLDEASLVGDSKSKPKFFDFGYVAGSGQLLTDLLNFFRLTDKQFQTKLILFGDPCQLPPVGESEAVALNPAVLLSEHGVRAEVTTLSKIIRHAAGSGIIKAATAIRDLITRNIPNFLILEEDGSSVKAITRPELINKAVKNAKKADLSAFIVVTSSNPLAFECNRQIRLGLGRPAGVVAGDRLMVCANNFVFDVLNGSFVTVVNVSQDVETVQVLGVDLRFQNVDIEDKGTDGETRVQTVKLLLNSLDDPKNADISDETRNALFVFFQERFAKLSPEAKKNGFRLREDLYFNAVRAKYGNAITCHKAQGGEWKEVAVVFGSFGPDDRTDVGSEEMRKWAYTALTRAKEVAFLEDAPEVHPLTRVQIQVVNGGLSSLKDRLKARIVEEYGIGTNLEFLCAILSDILAPAYCLISKTETMKDCYRITFEQSAEPPRRAIIDFYMRSKKGRAPIFGKVFAPVLPHLNLDAELTRHIQEELATALLGD